MVKTFSQLYLETRRILSAREAPQDAGVMARNLISHITGKSREFLLANGNYYANQEDCAAVETAVNRLLAGEPLAYILGEWDFFGMTLCVNEYVLIPRDDTCALVALAIGKLENIEHPLRVLDLCTGSGCIGLAIAKHTPNAKVTLGDISREALTVAKKNVVLHGMSGRVSCVVLDALEEPGAYLGKFDLIVSNPPYITTQEMQELPVSVGNYEPHLALHGGEDGLCFYRAITEKYKVALKPGGFLAFEFGMGQGDAVCRILEQNGYTLLERVRDYHHIERAVIARLDREDVE